MMNGTKKSDSSIVPAKPTNKAERSTAELVEGDDGTKRNAELQSTVRTQSREAVTQSYRQILVTAGPVRRRRLWADGRSAWR
jgi:RNA-directed DNA polymerase